MVKWYHSRLPSDRPGFDSRLTHTLTNTNVLLAIVISLGDIRPCYLNTTSKTYLKEYTTIDITMWTIQRRVFGVLATRTVMNVSHGVVFKLPLVAPKASKDEDIWLELCVGNYS